MAILSQNFNLEILSKKDSLSHESNARIILVVEYEFNPVRQTYNLDISSPPSDSL